MLYVRMLPVVGRVIYVTPFAKTLINPIDLSSFQNNSKWSTIVTCSVSGRQQQRLRSPRASKIVASAVIGRDVTVHDYVTWFPYSEPGLEVRFVIVDIR